MKLLKKDLKGQVKDYLILLEAQGKLWFEWLDSGRFIVIQPDMPGLGCRVIFLELKAKTKQSEAQKQFQRTAEAQGAEYMLIKSIEDVMEILEGN